MKRRYQRFGRRGTLRAAPILVAALAMVASGARATPPRLHVVPLRVVEGDPVSIRITGALRGGLALVRAQSVVVEDGVRVPYTASAAYYVGAGGTVDVTTAVPVTGSYRGADPRGLFWSQRPLPCDPVARAAEARHLDNPANMVPGQVVLRLDSGHGVDDRKILTFVPAAGLVREGVRADGLVGVFYHVPRTTRQPAVIALGGSEGGLDVADWLGPKLAARGVAVFGLDYFSPPESAVAGVPTSLVGIPVESLEKVRAWLKGRPEVDADRLGLVGYSKGAEFALVAASTFDWIRAVVAYAPTDFVWQGIRRGGAGPVGSSWTLGGKDLVFLPTTGTREAIASARQSGARIFLARLAKANVRAASPEAREAAAIRVERSHAALLLIGGDDDQLWDSGASVERLAARLEHAAYPHPYEALRYPGAGHVLLGTGWRPTTSDDADQFANGGTAQADAKAQGDSWAKVLAFLTRELLP